MLVVLPLSHTLVQSLCCIGPSNLMVNSEFSTSTLGGSDCNKMVISVAYVVEQVQKTAVFRSCKVLTEEDNAAADVWF